MAQLVERSPMDQKVNGSLPHHGTCPGWGLTPQLECVQKAAMQSYSLTHPCSPLPLLSSLKSIRTYFKQCFKNNYGDYGYRKEPKCYKNGQFNNIIKIRDGKKGKDKKCENGNVFIFHGKESINNV